MNIFTRIKVSLHPIKQDYIPILTRQTEFLSRTIALLGDQLSSDDLSARKSIEKEVKATEVQGDALLTEFHDQLAGRFFGKMSRTEIQSISMAMDDCLDVIKDTSKAINLYCPERIDDQLKELAQLAKSQSLAVHEMVPVLYDLKKNSSSLMLHCDRVTELEHIADDTYENYIGQIFKEEGNVRELIKYKKLAEMLENVTDAYKKISDCFRKLFISHLSD